MLHLPLLINTLPGDRVLGEECLAVTALHALRRSPALLELHALRMRPEPQIYN